MKRFFPYSLLLVAVIFCFESCYTVKLTSRNGTRNPCVHGDCDSEKWHSGLQTVEINKVVKSSIMNDVDELKVTGSDLCKSGKIHSVEFTNTFGGTLLYLVTFGSRKKVKITYICMLEEN